MYKSVSPRKQRHICTRTYVPLDSLASHHQPLNLFLKFLDFSVEVAFSRSELFFERVNFKGLPRLDSFAIRAFPRSPGSTASGT